MSFDLRDLPQSSLKSDDGESILNPDKFINTPHYLFDQEDMHNDWSSIVNQLQLENASLIHSLRETNLDLMQSRREKEELENFYQRQTETTDKIVSRLRRENQKNDHDKVSDLIFQKRYIMLENQALKESLSELHEYYGIEWNKKPPHSLSKWRSCVYVLIALQRFQLKQKSL